MKKNLLIFGLCMILLVVGMVSATEYYFNDTSHGGSSTSSTCNATSPCSDLSQLTSTPDYNSHVNFACGNTFRGDYIYAGRNNVSYNSYGDSSLGKPKIKGSIYLNSSNTSCFYNISSTLWKLNTTCLTLPSDPQTMYYNTTGDTGTLIMLRDTTSDTTPSTEWEYYYNVTNKSVTIKTNGSNPLSYGNGIEIPRYNYSDSAYSSFMFIDQDDNVNVTGLSFYYLREGGIRIYDGNNVRITGNEFHFAYNKVMTISQGADNVIIDGNNFTDVGIRGMDEPYGQEAQGEIIFASESGIRNTTITNNKILRGAGVPINIVRTAGWTIVQNNSITNCTTSGAGTGNDWSAGIYFDGADNGIISYNNITNCHIGIHVGNEIAGTIAENNNITYNIISRNKISDIIIDCNAGTNGYCTNNTRVLQNTLYKNSNVTGSGYGHQTFYANATYLYVKDNIIFNNYTSTTEGDLIIYKNDTLMTNINMSYNDYNSTSGRNVYNKNTGTYTSLTSWQTAMGQEANSITNNPLFTDAANLDFRPIAGSAVCNASSNGSYIGAIPCSDDTTPPVNITNLNSPSQGETWIYINWTNPTDSDFNHTEIFRNETSISNTSNAYINSTGLNTVTSYTYRLVPVDNTGNRGNNASITNNTKDLTNPTINLISPINGTITNNPTPTITFNYTDSNSGTANCTIRGNYYQETADNRYSEGWDGYGWDVVDCIEWFDGNWNNLYSALSCPSLPYDWYYRLWYDALNYTYKYNATGAIWKIKTGSYPYIENLTLPQYCMNRTDGRIYFEMYIDYLSITSSYYGCNGDSILNSTMIARDQYLAEEAVLWTGIILGQNTSVINNTQTNITSVNLLDGNYTNITIQCTDNNSNIGVSSYINFVVATNPYISITNPANGSNISSNNMNITYQLLGNATENPISYYNISLLNNDTSFNITIQGNNSNNLSYYWTEILVGYSPGTYIIKVDAINSSGTIFATGNSTYSIVTNAYLYINATGVNSTGGIERINNYTITLIPGSQSYNTTNGNISFGIFQNYTYNITISNSGYASLTATNLTFSSVSNYYTFNLTYLNNSLYITFKDEDNNTIITGTNIGLDLIGDDYADNYSTTNGQLNISNLIMGDYIIRYYATGYDTRFYYVNISDQSTQSLTLYMILTTASDNITITVIDQNANPVPDSKVKALKYYLDTNSYVLQEVGITDNSGETIMHLTKNDEFYKFMVEYEGVLKTTTVPAYITSDSLTIQIILGEIVGTTFFNYMDLYTYLTFNTATDNFRLDYDDTSGITESVCLEVMVLSTSGTTFYNSSCESVASGTLLVSVNPISGTTYLGKSFYYYLGDKIYLNSYVYSYPRTPTFNNGYGLLLQIIITLFIAFIAVWSIPLASILVPLSLIIGRIINLNLLGWNSLSAILIVGLIIAYMTREK